MKALNPDIDAAMKFAAAELRACEHLVGDGDWIVAQTHLWAAQVSLKNAERMLRPWSKARVERAFAMAVQPPPLAALTDAQRARATELLVRQNRPYAAVQSALREEFDVRVSLVALARFHQQGAQALLKAVMRSEVQP